MLRTFLIGSATALMVAGIAATGQAGETFDKIKERGELATCIKVDYRPFGFRGPGGEMIGIEHDLVADLQRRLSETFDEEIKVDKIPVIAANRIQFLQQGKCDLLIATMTDKPERRELINIIEPSYYSSGINILAKKSTPINEWEDIRGQTICTSQGAFWNKDMQRKYDLNLLAFAGIAETEQALRDGRCIASLSDDSLINSRLQDQERWGDFEMKLETINDAPWGVAIQHGDEDFQGFVSDAVKDWHRTGLIMDLEKKWGATPTKWIREQHEKYKNM